MRLILCGQKLVAQNPAAARPIQAPRVGSWRHSARPAAKSAGTIRLPVSAPANRTAKGCPSQAATKGAVR